MASVNKQYGRTVFFWDYFDGEQQVFSYPTFLTISVIFVYVGFLELIPYWVVAVALVDYILYVVLHYVHICTSVQQDSQF